MYLCKKTFINLLSNDILINNMKNKIISCYQLNKNYKLILFNYKKIIILVEIK